MSAGLLGPVAEERLQIVDPLARQAGGLSPSLSQLPCFHIGAKRAFQRHIPPTAVFFCLFLVTLIVQVVYCKRRREKILRFFFKIPFVSLAPDGWCSSKVNVRKLTLLNIKLK